MGQLTLGNVYCAPNIRAAWKDDMTAVADLPDWAEAIERNPGNRQRILDQDRDEFIATMERWMMAYCPRRDEHVPGSPDDRPRHVKVPTIVFRSGESDAYHPGPPPTRWPGSCPTLGSSTPRGRDTEWNDGTARRAKGEQQGAFERWPLLVPQLLDWAGDALG